MFLLCDMDNSHRPLLDHSIWTIQDLEWSSIYQAENIMYYLFSRTVFSLGIALMIYACHNGFGGIIDKFLSWSFWVPLSRLTFMVYLIHPIVITLMYKTLRFRFIYTDWLLMIMFTAAAMLSYSLSLVIAVTVEYPVINLEKAVYKLTGIKKRN